MSADGGTTATATFDQRVPPELVGREVSTRALSPFWQLLPPRGIDPQRLAVGTGCSLEHLTDARERISWHAFSRVVANLGELFDEDELVAAGAASLGSAWFKTMLVPGKLLFGVKDLYFWVFGPTGPGSQLVACNQGTIYEVAPGHLRFETRMKPGYPPSRENYLLLRGCLQGLSAALGAGAAEVTQRALPDGVVYDIRVAQDRGMLGSVRGALSWMFAARSAGEELRRAHLELYDRYAELQREIEARTRTEAERRLLEEQLRQVQKMEAVGRLAGGIAHDFNNLLSVILSYTSMLLAETQPDAPMHAELEQIHKAGGRATELTRQLLAFSRQHVIEARIVDLSEIVAGMESMLRRVIGEHLVLETHTVAGLGSVKADAGHIEQVIMNLVVNARDAMPHGGKVTIQTANVELDASYAREHLGVVPGSHVLLAVSDTGMGMDKATQERIFDPFFTTKETGKGTGLGLSIVFGIAKQSGGSLWVDSEPGKGSTFKLYFPIASEAV